MKMSLDYRGLGRFAARKQVVEDLKAQGLLEKIENYTIKCPRRPFRSHLRTHLTDQWYVQMT